MGPDVRAGQGTDRHRLEEGESLIIGGVQVESKLGTVGHSDGDVLIHAIIDALLGGAGLSDIGEHFPDTEPRWAEVNSGILLEETVDKLDSHGWRIVNVDSTVRLESIRLASYRARMINSVEQYFPEQSSVNVKFSTGEQLGPVGRDEAIEAQAVALLRNET
ncbi:MAG: 2-C-methyl-D-erythritol 2,4-cyclodiphosphate synthase [bacterium]